MRKRAIWNVGTCTVDGAGRLGYSTQVSWAYQCRFDEDAVTRQKGTAAAAVTNCVIKRSYVSLEGTVESVICYVY